MQTLLASLVVSMSVKDAAYRAGMATARREASRTGQDVERSMDGMATAVQGAARQVNQAAIDIATSLAGAAEKMKRTGVIMTAAVSAPIALIGKRSKDSAADFETAFNKVRAAMLTATPEQLEKLNAAALELGPSIGRSASEAAAGIEMLAKNGLSAAQILRGGLAAAMTLSAVGGADLSDSADLTTDIMQQFGKRAGELPGVVDKVTGALDASKMSFDDYRLAIGQAGGIAGGLGVSFEETNVALAATASFFESGSDAGTSFKTFLTSLNPKSKEAASTMEALGLSFFNADGSAKSLAEVAELLRQRLANLNDEAKRKALTAIFGQDGMRTAIALMQQGSAGLEEMSQAIDAIQAKDKIAVLQAGDEAATARLTAALNVLAIRMGEVLLPVSIAVKNAITGVVQALASAPGQFFVFSAAAAIAVAAVGPLVAAFGAALPVAIGLAATRLTGLGAVLGFIINPFGAVIRAIGGLLIARGAATAVGLLGARIAALAGPIGIAVALATILIPKLVELGTNQKEIGRATDLTNEVTERSAEIMAQLATATGEAASKLRDQAAALREVARDSLVAARGLMETARAQALAAIQADEKGGVGSGSPFGIITGALLSARRKFAVENYERVSKLYGDNVDIYAALGNSIEGSRTRGDPAGPTDYSLPEKEARKKKGKSANDQAREEARYLDELGRLRVAEMDALADLTDSHNARYRADSAALDEEVASFRRQVDTDDSLNAAKRAELIAAKEAEVDRRRQVVERDLVRGEEQHRYELLRAANEADQDMARLGIDMAETYAERRAGELRLLALQRRLEEAELDRVLAVAATGTAEWQNAFDAKQRLKTAYAAREARVRRDTESPAERYMRQIDLSTTQVREATEEIGVSGLQRFNDTLADTATGFLKLGGVAGQVFNQLIADMMRVQLQRALIQPIAKMIFGASGGGLDTSSAQAGVTSFLDNYLSYGGGKASGGRVSPRSWYMVGENGPEPFVPDTAGTIIPNSGLKKAGGGAMSFDLRGAVMTDQLLAQMQVIANDTGGKIVADNNRRTGRASARRMGGRGR